MTHTHVLYQRSEGIDAGKAGRNMLASTEITDRELPKFSFISLVKLLL